MSGRFITFEGIDGAGKSSHIDALARWLRAKGHDVLVTREPGGTPLAEHLRELFLRDEMDALTECLLVFAARRDHLRQRIEPALAAGITVLCDRFTDATFAYQGGGHGVPADFIAALAQRIHGDCNPDVTLLFDVPPAVSRERLTRAAAVKNRPLDKFEREAQDFFERVRAVYAARARAEPHRFRVIDATRPLQDVRAEVAAIVTAL